MAAHTPVDAAPVVPVGTACKDVPEAETHLAVLMSSADVLAVYELKANERLDEATIALGDGARVVLAARPYATSAWLERAIGCHLAKNAARGKANAASSTSPLDVEGIVVVVTGSTPGELAVDITSSKSDRAREILARARALVPRAAFVPRS
jgi:hypothetical protein